MKLVSVTSSNIKQVGFEENQIISFGQESMNVLRVVFSSEEVYDYYRVPKEVYEGLLEAESAGRYFYKNIKNKYTYEKK